MKASHELDLPLLFETAATKAVTAAQCDDYSDDVEVLHNVEDIMPSCAVEPREGNVQHHLEKDSRNCATTAIEEAQPGLSYPTPSPQVMHSNSWPVAPASNKDSYASSALPSGLENDYVDAFSASSGMLQTA